MVAEIGMRELVYMTFIAESSCVRTWRGEKPSYNNRDYGKDAATSAHLYDSVKAVFRRWFHRCLIPFSPRLCLQVDLIVS